MEYEVKLEIFEGPLDLLLHLIHKSEVDVFDIPITTIADQYLAYLDMMKALNISVAGDFLVMASTLIHIKSKMLLPGLNEGDEGEDPRDEITRPLLEYMRLKEMAEELSEREILGKDVFARQDFSLDQDQIDAEVPQLDVSLFQLIDAFKRIMEKIEPGAKLTIQYQKWSIKEKSQLIISLMKEKGEMFFDEIFTEDRSVPELIVTFLALLELVHTGLIRVFQPSHGSGIRLVAHFDQNERTDNDEKYGETA